MRAFFVAVVVALVSGLVGAADITIRSVPYEQPKPVVQQVQPKVVKVEPVYVQQNAGACPCGYSLACVGPKGGRYCINKNGQKKYM